MVFSITKSKHCPFKQFFLNMNNEFSVDGKKKEGMGSLRKKLARGYGLLTHSCKQFECFYAFYNFI